MKESTRVYLPRPFWLRGHNGTVLVHCHHSHGIFGSSIHLSSVRAMVTTCPAQNSSETVSDYLVNVVQHLTELIFLFISKDPDISLRS